MNSFHAIDNFYQYFPKWYHRVEIALWSFLMQHDNTHAFGHPLCQCFQHIYREYRIFRTKTENFEQKANAFRVYVVLSTENVWKIFHIRCERLGWEFPSINTETWEPSDYKLSSFAHSVENIEQWEKHSMIQLAQIVTLRMNKSRESKLSLISAAMVTATGTSVTRTSDSTFCQLKRWQYTTLTMKNDKLFMFTSL